MNRSVFTLLIATGIIFLFSNCAKDTFECLQIDCPQTLVDARNNESYQTVTICNQCWMSENLNYEIRGGSWCYKDIALNCNNFGRLYDWGGAMDGHGSSNNNPSGVQGVCPAGWHLPSQSEWEEFIMYMEDQEWKTGDAMKVILNIWSNNTNATNASGFSALPAAYYDSGDNHWKGHNQSTAFWTTTESGQQNTVYAWWLFYNNENASEDLVEKDMRFSVRCLKDQ
jgi:uncharacterized protein (TIGR02145 family)